MRQTRAQQISKIALAAAVTLVAILGIQNRSLKERYKALIEESTGPYEGLAMPAFDAATLRGDSVTIGAAADGAHQVLFFFAAACPTSRRTIPTWNRIASTAQSTGRFAVFGIQLDTADITVDYPDADEPTFPVLRLPDARLRQWYRVDGVPITVVLDALGRVAYRKLGGISDQPTIDSVLTAATKTEVVADLVTVSTSHK